MQKLQRGQPQDLEFKEFKAFILLYSNSIEQQVMDINRGRLYEPKRIRAVDIDY